MHDDSALVEARLNRFVRERLQPAIYRATTTLTVTAWVAPGEPVLFAEAVSHPFVPFSVGEAWGRPWGTVWFHLTGTVPAEWASTADSRIEVVIDLGFTTAVPGFQAEGTAYSADGRLIKGIESLNRTVRITGEAVDLYIEAAANPNIAADFSFTPTALGDLATAGSTPLYRLRQADVAARDMQVWHLAQDVFTLDGLRRELPAASPRRANILRALERCLDLLDPDDLGGTARAGRAALAAVLASPANASAHRVYAVGHAHIDSAWLWPVRETVRKVARTFSNVLDLIDRHPDFVFAASSAQQYAWLAQFYPELFERVRLAVAAGTFVPVGGMWVESDTNMPGGEALARQFVAGKRFFMEQFGVEPLEVWLPDSFGYSAALPQIVRAAGSRWFLTQKLSWNDTNVFPHHSFLWEGIDGSRIFTHFPPVADYNAQLSGLELARAERLFAEKGFSNTSLVPFGWGDGGGGPTEEMIAAAHRAASLEGSPTVKLSSPRRFFEAAEAEYAAPPVWSGELYLEFHRGTLTSQARTKQGNRRSEHLLREAELWATTASIRVGASRSKGQYPRAALENAWQTVLLHQFHDILPGSSIAWVHQQAEREYVRVAGVLEGVIEASVRALCGTGDNAVVLNAGPYAQAGVPALGGLAPRADSLAGATIARTPDGWVLTNRHVKVAIDPEGLFSSVYDRNAEREVVPPGARANLLTLHRDTPTQWDAWDIDTPHARLFEELTHAESVEQLDELPPGRVGVRIIRRFGASSVIEDVTLTGESSVIDLAFDIDWHEREKLLRLNFALDVRADRAASEIQFGHIFRPTHANTSWDAARFETVAHRWVHVGEPGFGVAVANDSTYGHAICRTAFSAVEEDAAAAIGTTVALSLLRAPRYPDPSADQGRHCLRVALRTGASIRDAVYEGYRLNLPLRTVTGVGARPVEALFTVDNPAVVVEAVKLSGDDSGDVIVRVYEAHGTRARARIIRSFDAVEVYETDLLERRVAPAALIAPDGAAVTVELRPFQLLTLRFTRSTDPK
ncbi:glycoside hydrolase family 38 C-terminal domain-containing protein [Cryobacterium sp. PH31-O1]|uniref:alpha-mannosidase n=1 Tax=Cryobacterium sp. PH31-O1 TaxID=3046306 RepID=UPI0024B89EFA|nr:glycoside hydrolase family 38 C-terminal domain-containing protein [Cryobacterium sp. PH31-O1]MDJ0338108.1 glycoside hydrolase family 38 C-terminal domain-containing protein [Cryobacterium sp. PH31-O1]